MGNNTAIPPGLEKMDPLQQALLGQAFGVSPRSLQQGPDIQSMISSALGEFMARNQFGWQTPQAQQGALMARPEYAQQVQYSQTARPGFQEFGPSGQFYQPIYRPNYASLPAAPTQTPSRASPVTVAAGIPQLLSMIRAGDTQAVENSGLLKAGGVD